MPKRTLNLARGLRFPLDAVTETFGFLARRKAGKTYCAQKLAEEMLDVGAQIVVLDPVGNWWCLRLAADGKTPAYDIPVFGGSHQDIPLSPDAGELVADTVADTGTSVILDVSLFSKRARKTFVADFCERLFLRRKQQPHATHVFMEESHAFCPQRYRAGDARMVGAIEDIVKVGRNFGLGATMISQRPMSVNKEILNLVECLFMMQMRGPHERKAMRDWIDYKGVEARDVIDELPTLQTGEAWVSSPQLLADLKRVQIDEKKTYDASSAPKVGGRGRAKKLKKLDLRKLEEAMKEVVESAAANDPTRLRQEVARLDRELGKRVASAPAPALSAEEREQIEAEAEARGFERGRAAEEQRWTRAAAGLPALLEASLDAPAGGPPAPRRRRRSSQPTSPPQLRVVQPQPREGGDGELAPADLQLLNALAWWDAVGVKQPTRLQVAFVCRTHPRTKSHTNRISRLKSTGYIDYPHSGSIELTELGWTRSTPPLEPGTTEVLQAMVFGQLPPALQAILRAVVDVYPDALTREQLAAACDTHPRTKSHTNAISRLRGLGVLTYPQSGSVRASDQLFIRKQKHQ